MKTDEDPAGEMPAYDHRTADRVAGVVCAYISHNQLPVERLPELVKIIAAALAGGATPEKVARGEPAVPVKKSVGDDFIICLEDGKKLTMLKRYLRAQYNMSPEDYQCWVETVIANGPVTVEMVDGMAKAAPAKEGEGDAKLI